MLGFLLLAGLCWWRFGVVGDEPVYAQDTVYQVLFAAQHGHGWAPDVGWVLLNAIALQLGFGAWSPLLWGGLAGLALVGLHGKWGGGLVSLAAAPMLMLAPQALVVALVLWVAVEGRDRVQWWATLVVGLLTPLTAVVTLPTAAMHGKRLLAAAVVGPILAVMWTLSGSGGLGPSLGVHPALGAYPAPSLVAGALAALVLVSGASRLGALMALPLAFVPACAPWATLLVLGVLAKGRWLGFLLVAVLLGLPVQWLNLQQGRADAQRLVADVIPVMDALGETELKGRVYANRAGLLSWRTGKSGQSKLQAALVEPEEQTAAVWQPVASNESVALVAIDRLATPVLRGVAEDRGLRLSTVGTMIPASFTHEDGLFFPQVDGSLVISTNGDAWKPASHSGRIRIWLSGTRAGNRPTRFQLMCGVVAVELGAPETPSRLDGCDIHEGQRVTLRFNDDAVIDGNDRNIIVHAIEIVPSWSSSGPVDVQGI